MIYFFDKQAGYSFAQPSSFISFESAAASLILMSLNLAGMTELPAPDFIRRCSKVLVIPNQRTKSPFTRSVLKDNLRKLATLCDELGPSGVIAWE